jgi:AraC-like DNA-binding protein
LRYDFTTLKKTILVEQGSGIVIPKNVPYHATYLFEDTKIKMLSFDMKGDSILKSFDKPCNVKSPEISLLFSSISPQNIHNSLFLSARIYELLYYLEQIDESVPKKYRKLSPALLDLKRQYFKNEKISYYAELCSMSESNFRKLFREYTGKSPIEYRNLIRISAVQALLNTGEATINEAAYLVGFNNMSFFYEVYNKYKKQIT